MIKLKLESWSAMAPGMEDSESWQHWLKDRGELPAANAIKLKQVPPLLRRRFSTLGKFAAHAVFELLDENSTLPTIFASRHGDTELTLSLLEEIGREEPLSPTRFSLAVHNAIGGLLSIARHDRSPMTAIACMDNLVLSTLQEAVAQLEAYEKVLCVIYDVPLPGLYSAYAEGGEFPLAIAFVLSRADSADLTLTSRPAESADVAGTSHDDLFEFITLLSGMRNKLDLNSRQMTWRLESVAAA